MTYALILKTGKLKVDQGYFIAWFERANETSIELELEVDRD